MKRIALTVAALTLLGAAVYFGILILVDRDLREDARRTLRIRWVS